MSLEARRPRGQLQSCTCSGASHLCREVVAGAEGGPEASAVVADGGAWWAAVYGIAQSWTQLKRQRVWRSGGMPGGEEHGCQGGRNQS